MQRLEEEYRSIVSELDEAFHGQHSKDLDKPRSKPGTA